jgi:hypothetical protein
MRTSLTSTSDLSRSSEAVSSTAPAKCTGPGEVDHGGQLIAQYIEVHIANARGDGAIHLAINAIEVARGVGVEVHSDTQSAAAS